MVRPRTPMSDHVVGLGDRGEMGTLDRHRRDWEELAELDPLWAILSDPSRRFGRWELDEFFATGEREVAAALARAEAHGLPRRHEVAVDLGCGVGRLTRALASRFGDVHGIDISETMVATARRLSPNFTNCSFRVNADPALSEFDDATVDLVYSVLVFQHMPTRSTIETYLRSIMRILRPGGIAMFQLPSYVPFRRRLQPRRRAYQILRRLGFSGVFLYSRLGLAPMRLNFVTEARVRSLVMDAGREVIESVRDDRAGPGVESRTYLVR